MNILILEDEPLIAQRLERMVKELLPSSLDYHIQWLRALDKAIDFAAKESIDLCFLDLNLSGQNGFQLIERSKKEFQTIITSAYTERAIEAFSWGVIDFVPKPFQRERLKTAIKRYLSQYGTEQQALIVACKQSQKVLPLREVSFIRAAGNYSQVTSIDQKQYLHQDNIGQLTDLLQPVFIRLHKSYLVPRRQIAEVKNHGGGKYEVMLKDGKMLPVSRSVYPQLHEVLTR